ncbi:protein of unknown function [uncultured Mediterranean phage uvMED]|nr:protein of unknown function [uncultured Mediterranean phage uvMED]
MPLVPLNFPPGVWKNGSEYEAKGRYFDANLVRWKNGRLRPIGGWRLINTSTLTGKGRSMIAWRTSTGNRYIAIGTSSKLYVYAGASSTPSDVTPTGFVGGNEIATAGQGYGAGPFNGTGVNHTYSATTISADTTDDSFNDSASGFNTSQFGAGDLIQVSGFAQTANNKAYPSSHRISSITTSKIIVDTNLTTDTNSTPNSITISKARAYGDEDYAGAIEGTSAIVTQVARWTFDLWGDTLIACCNSDGKVYKWNENDANATLAIANGSTAILTGVETFVVTQEKHVMLFGPSTNERKVQWSTQGNFDDYSSSTSHSFYPTTSNSAGDFELETLGTIQSATKVGKDVLVFTDTDAHIVQHIGVPYIYSRRKVGSACGIIGPKAFAVQKGLCAWMGNGGFFIYDGTVRQLPCDVNDFVFDNINTTQQVLTYGVSNAKNNELWWFYVSSASSEIDSAVVWNFEENWWTIHKLDRTAMIDVGVFDYPIALNSSNLLFSHEQARTNSGARLDNVTVPVSDAQLSTVDRVLSFGMPELDNREEAFTYAETGAIEFGAGDRVVHAKRIITDSSAGNKGVRFKIKSRFTPDDTQTTSPIYDLQDDGFTDIRVTGRQLSLRIESPFDQDFEIGNLRADASLGGKR